MSPSTPEKNARLIGAGRLMAGLFVVAGLSQAKLQTLERKNTVDLAMRTDQFTREQTDHARRGAILTADGKPVAQDEATTELSIQFEKVPHTDAFFLDLAKASGIPASEFEALAEGGVKTKSWLTPLTPAQSAAVDHVRVAWRASGVSVARSGERDYPLADAASCFVGFIREYAGEGTVRTGLEASLNQALTGSDGQKTGLTDRSGAFLPLRMQETGKPRQDGKDVTLTIDSELQAAAYRAVSDAVESNKADNGVAIVMNPRTGDVLAMANYPSFDPNQGSDHVGKNPQGFNPAYMAVLEPGSTFKILTLAKALDEGKTDMGNVIDCEGELHIGKAWRIRCDMEHGTRSHGPVTPVMAIAKSCNVSAATWALRVGREKFLKYVEDLGLLKRKNLGVPGEQHGLFNYNEYAKPLQLANVGFGQSISCTPIGLASAFSMIANGGVRVEPRLIAKIGGQEQPIRQGSRLIRQDTAEKVMSCMEAVIGSDEGTGASLRIPGYRLAGKTGTAQKINRKEHGYVANFVGFVPAPNPKAVILVMINHPQGSSYYGAKVAGPAFVKIAKAVIHHFNLPPTEPIAEPSPTVARRLGSGTSRGGVVRGELD